MLSQEVEFKDFNGKDHKETLWFHISKKDVLLLGQEAYDDILALAAELQDLAEELETAGPEFIEGDEVVTLEALESSPGELSEGKRKVAEGVRLMGRMLDRVVDLSYGKRSADGMGFNKSPEILTAFKSSIAYDAFLETLLADADVMLAFIGDLLPSNV